MEISFELYDRPVLQGRLYDDVDDSGRLQGMPG